MKDKELLREMCKNIIDFHKQYNGERDKCIYCNGSLKTWLSKEVDHEEDCIVLKAQDWLNNNKE